MKRTIYFLLVDVVVLLFQITTILCSILFLVVFRSATRLTPASSSSAIWTRMLSTTNGTDTSEHILKLFLPPRQHNSCNAKIMELNKDDALIYGTTFHDVNASKREPTILMAKVTKKKKYTCSRLLVFLAITDLLSAVTTIPYSVYLVANWNPRSIDLNPYYVAILGAPAPFFLKVHLVLTISAAFERTLALFFPLHYRRLSLSMFAIIVLLISLILAAFDISVGFTLLTFELKPECAALGCFLGHSHSLAAFYWGTNTLIFNLIAAFLTVLFIVKLRCSQRTISRTHGAHQGGELNNPVQANRICAGIILTSLAFVTSPCVVMNVVNICGGSVYMDAGPFTFAFLLCNGTFTNIVHLMMNRNMREQTKTFIMVGRFAAIKPVAPKEQFAAAGSRATMPHIS